MAKANNFNGREKILIQNAKLSYPNLYQKGFYQGREKDNYDCQLLIEPDNPVLQEIKSEVEYLASKLGTPIEELGCCFKKSKEDGFEDWYVISVKSKRKPLIIDKDETPLLEDTGKVYAGCRVDALISLWGCGASGNAFGIWGNMHIIQFAKDDAAFSGEMGQAELIKMMSKKKGITNENKNPFAGL